MKNLAIDVLKNLKNVKEKGEKNWSEIMSIKAMKVVDCDKYDFCI